MNGIGGPRVVVVVVFSFGVPQVLVPLPAAFFIFYLMGRRRRPMLASDSVDRQRTALL